MIPKMSKTEEHFKSIFKIVEINRFLLQALIKGSSIQNEYVNCQITVHWNPSIVDFVVKAKSSTIEGFSTNEGFLCSEKIFSQA